MQDPFQNEDIIRQCQQQFMKDQIHEIEVYKWVASEQAGKDLGNDIIKYWICNFAKEYRVMWFNKYNG